MWLSILAAAGVAVLEYLLYKPTGASGSFRLLQKRIISVSCGCPPR